MSSHEPTTATPPSVLAALVERHRQGLQRYLRVLGCADDVVDDVLQETFLAVLRRGDFVDHDRRATAAFLQRTARHLFLKTLRRHDALREVEEADRLWQEECGADDGDGWLEALQQCLDRLPERSRALLAATYGEGLGRNDAAERFALTADGVKTALRRLRTTLRTCVERRRNR